jgi:flagellar basal body rod protein FlgC
MARMDGIASLAVAGLNASTTRFEASAKRVVQDPGADLASELVTQKMAAMDFEANAAVLKRANAMTKSLLDILA